MVECGGFKNGYHYECIEDNKGKGSRKAAEADGSSETTQWSCRRDSKSKAKNT